MLPRESVATQQQSVAKPQRARKEAAADDAGGEAAQGKLQASAELQALDRSGRPLPDEAPPADLRASPELDAIQRRKAEPAIEREPGWQRIDEMPLSEIAERMAARREADEALAAAKRRKLNGGHEPAPAAARSA
jgi:hypothetical protein